MTSLSIRRYPPDAVPQSEPSETLPAFDVSLPGKQHADIHLIAESDGQTVARCSLWWHDVPAFGNATLGTIGHYAAASRAAAATLLEHACTVLRGQGCSLAVGPMNGNTWRHYRFVTDPGDERPFLLEPANPPEYPNQWRAAGFMPLASYRSEVTSLPAAADPRLPRILERLDAAGISIRTLNAEMFEQELRAIYEVARVAFRSNYLYTPLSENDFLEQYLPAQPLVDPRLCLIAEKRHLPVGFAFALPNPDGHGGSNGVIFKTLAVLPGRELAGLGVLLAQRVREAAGKAGARRIIHALMHDSNQSTNLLGDMRVMRRYTLFSRILE